MEKKWDVFISHASEDKKSIVRELAEALEKLKVKVWYDEFSLSVGDSLTKSIDEGLIKSKFGIVVISKSFLAKNWPDYEYRSLISKEVNGKKVILPIWHDVTPEDVGEFSLYLADKVALNTSKDTVKQLALKLTKVVRPEVFESIRRYWAFKKVIKNADTKLIDINSIKRQEKPQSKLSKNLLVRAKSIFFGIGECFDFSWDEAVYNYELDLHPAREIQSWEIMNASYLEYINRHNILEKSTKKAIAKWLIGISIGSRVLIPELSEEQKEEILALYKEHHYEY